MPRGLIWSLLLLTIHLCLYAGLYLWARSQHLLVHSWHGIAPGNVEVFVFGPPNTNSEELFCADLTSESKFRDSLWYLFLPCRHAESLFRFGYLDPSRPKGR